MLIVCDEAGSLRALDWENYEERLHRLLRRHYRADGYELVAAKNAGGNATALSAYMAGEIDAIADLKTETVGTAFQREVWQALRTIPAGNTLSYGQLAERIGRPRAVRAVGLANGSNPVGIVVPCHRVIGANGSLTGYGGGLERKRWLLAHEAKYVNAKAA